MKTKLFSLVIAALLFNITIAQEAAPTGCATPISGHMGNGTINSVGVLNLLANGSPTAMNTATSTIPVMGSPYLTANFEKSSIYFNNELQGEYYARYNAYSKEIEIKKTDLAEEDHKALIRDEKIKLIFDDKEIQYATFIDEDGLKQEDYLISKTKGANYQLFKRLSVKYKEGKEAENSFIAAVPQKFYQYSEFYLKNLNTNLVSYIPTKKSKLLNLFKNDDKIQIASLIKKNSLNIKNEEALVQIFNFVNTLGPDYAVMD